jgi:hypothetical protein
MKDRNMSKNVKKCNPKGGEVLRRPKMGCCEDETNFYHKFDIMKEYIFRICFVNLSKVY